MRWLVTIDEQVVTERAMVAHGHRALAAIIREHGRSTLAVRDTAEFADEDRACDFADRLAGTFPEDEVALWQLVRRVDRQRGPARRAPGQFDKQEGAEHDEA